MLKLLKPIKFFGAESLPTTRHCTLSDRKGGENGGFIYRKTAPF